MAIGKNKRLKSGRKLNRKGVRDPFLRKEWYDVIAPNNFANRKIGKTCVNKTAGLKISSDSLKGRVFEANLADLQRDEDCAYRKMLFRVDEVEGRQCLTNFHGMNLTNDRLKSLVRKWQSLIEAHVDVKTVDGYVVRMFCIAFTAKQANAVRRKGHPLTTYAQSARIHQIRKRMMEIMRREASTCELHELVNKFIPEIIAKQIKKSCIGIYPIDNVFIRKVKLVKMPKYDGNKTLEAHRSLDGEDTGMEVEAPVDAEDENTEEAETEEPSTEEKAEN
jgi:small subunit ribosomal protein S3Ae